MAATKQEITVRPCVRCPTMIEARPNALYCDPCKKAVRKEHESQWQSQKRERRRQLEAMKSRNKVTPEDMAATQRRETLQDLGYMVRCFSDLGDSGPVIQYDHSSPEFHQLCIEYGGVPARIAT